LIAQPSALPSPQSAKDKWADAILDLEIPSWRFFKALATSMQAMAKVNEQAQHSTLPQADKRRAVLCTMALDELQTLHANLKANQERQLEAQRFYNQPNAQADFPYWLAMDFWTLDEAVALLLGKNPEIVNPASIDKDLEQPKGFFARTAHPPTAFTKFFQAAHLQAQRSHAMTRAKHLAPVEVAHWGQSVLCKRLPLPMAALLANALPAPVPIPVTVSVPVPVRETAAEAPDQTKEPRRGQACESVQVKRKALTAMARIWPTVESDLRHAGDNGLQAAAKGSQHGMWKEKEALEWARQQGKLSDVSHVPRSPGQSSIFHKIS
jgi:hypothetical protein